MKIGSKFIWKVRERENGKRENLKSTLGEYEEYKRGMSGEH